jgi:hypothetical protein
MKKFIIMNDNFTQIGGSTKKNLDIIKLLKTENLIKIESLLANLLPNKKLCQENLGDGHFGVVYKPNIGRTGKIEYKGKKYKVPIVVKEKKILDNKVLNFDIIDNKLYISGFDNITTEAIILMFTNQLFNHTVHLPYMIGYSTCLTNSTNVDKIISIKYGLKKSIKIDFKDEFFQEDKLWGRESKNYIDTTLNTLRKLLIYLRLNRKKDGTVKLPNGVICEISKLYDYICISYLCTHHLLNINKIFPSDMHSGNIFIHWLDTKSYLGDKVKKIIYKINDKFYEIETFGFVIILGDLGTCDIIIRDDVILVGQGSNIKSNYKLLEQRIKFNNCHQFICWSKLFLLLEDYKKTMGYNYLNSEIFLNEIQDVLDKSLGTSIQFLEKSLSAKKILDKYYKKYLSLINPTQSNKNSEILLIDCDYLIT